MIVRWGIEALPDVVPGAFLLVASERWPSHGEAARWTEVPSEKVDAAAALVPECVVALGGGSAVDLGKAISATSGAPLVSVPTTYAGAEFTTYFGIRSPDRRFVGGGTGPHLHGVVYEPRYTLDLPRETTVGTSMNALAHCAEALYVRNHNDEADEHALAGARLIGEWLPRVVETPGDLEARTELLRGACHAGQALGASGLALAHAMAQAIGGRYGLPHGTLNGICLPPALRFNEQLVPEAVRSFRDAVGLDVGELAALGGPTRLRDLGVPEDDLPELAARAEIEALLRSVY